MAATYVNNSLVLSYNNGDNGRTSTVTFVWYALFFFFFFFVVAVILTSV